jgi:hypothetical protein
MPAAGVGEQEQDAWFIRLRLVHSLPWVGSF